MNLFYDDRAKQIGERIKKERKKASLTQEELLEKVYLSKSSVASLRAWERGGRLPDTDTLARMCEVFDCDFGYLICDYDERDYSTHKIREATGLSENAIMRLYDMRKYNQITWYSDMLSAIIEHPEFGSMLSAMRDIVKAGEKESYIPNSISDYPESVKLRDVYQNKITNLLFEIITDIAPAFEERKDYRWMYDLFLGFYKNKDNNGNYHPLSEIKEEMEKNGLKFDPILFEGERDNG